MELRLRNGSGDAVTDGQAVLRVGAIGKLSRNGLSAKLDILQEAAGREVYSQKVLLSLEDCQHIDSSGVEWLLQCHHRFQHEGGQLVVHSVNAQVRQLLAMMRMNKVLTIKTDLESAELAAVTGG